MSDHPDAPLPELTPGQESDVRRLLAAARHEEPLPADVAERLDAVLAGLVRDGVRADDPAEDPTEDLPPAPVVDLAARRRRRNAAAALLGAAAVIVAGFGVGQVLDVGSHSDNGGSSTAADANRESAGGSADDQQGAAGGQDLTGSPHAQPAPSAAAELPLRLRSAHLEQDVSMRLRAYSAVDGGLRSPTDSQFDAAACPVPSPPGRFGPGDLFPALLDGRPAVLAVRPPADGVREADVLDCDTASELASVTIPAD